MATPKRKRRSRGEFLFGAPKGNLQWHHTLQPFDVLAAQLDEKWGPGRLAEIQDKVTRDRWQEVADQLDAAIGGKDEDALREAVETAMRGLQVMDAKAEAAGFSPAKGWAMLGEMPGGAEPFRFAVAPTDADARAASDRNPEAVVWTLAQVMALVKATMEAQPIGEVIEAFPNAKVTKIENLPADFWKAGGDPIPF